MLTDIILDGLRATALVAGLIVAGDAIRSLAGYVPMATATEAQHDVKWLLISLAGAVLGGTIFLSHKFGVDKDNEAFRVLILIGWSLFTSAIVFRASTRSARGGLMLSVMLTWFLANCVVSALVN